MYFKVMYLENLIWFSHIKCGALRKIILQLPVYVRIWTNVELLFLRHIARGSFMNLIHIFRSVLLCWRICTHDKQLLQITIFNMNISCLKMFSSVVESVFVQLHASFFYSFCIFPCRYFNNFWHSYESNISSFRIHTRNFLKIKNESFLNLSIFDNKINITVT